MDEEKKTTASDVLFQNVYQISEDVISATYKLVEDLSKFEAAFSNMARKLDSLNGNLNTFVIKKRWVKGTDKKRCQLKIDQSKELMTICSEYAKKCHSTSDELIAITERFESNKKVKNIIKNLVDKIEGDAKKIEEESSGATEEEDDDQD